MTNIRTILDRRTLLKGLAASAGVAILSACGDEAQATATRAAATVGSSAATTGAGAATTAATVAATRPASAVTTGTTVASAVTAATTAPSAVTTGAASAVTGTTAATAASTTAATTAATAAATTAPTAAATAAATTAATAATTGTVTGMTAPAVIAGGMPMGPTAAMCAMGSITSVGSTALQPFIEQAARAYSMRCMGAQINVQGGGSGTGLTQVFMGGATIGASDIFAEERDGIDARQLVDTVAVAQGFGIAANPNVPITTLTQDQVIGIWTGKFTNYKEVGGPDQAIVLINRPTSSGTRATFQKYALKGMREAQGRALTEDSTGAVAQAIKDTPGAIGYLVLAAIPMQGLKVVNFNGKAPTIENISDDSYPIWSYGHLYTKGMPTGLTKSFLDYLLTDDVQNTIVPNLGYFPISKIRAKKTP